MSAMPNGIIKGIQPVLDVRSRSYERREIIQLTSCILQSEASFMHLILLDVSPREVMHAARRIALHLQIWRVERPLLAHKDVEIIISSMQPRMSLRAERRPKDNEVLSDARVDDVHPAHRAACVAEDPFGRVGVDGDDGRRVRVAEIRADVLYHEMDIIRFGRSCDCGARELVQALGREDIPPVLNL